MKPRLSQIIWNDWPALAFAIGVGLSVLLYFGLPLVRGGVDPQSRLWFCTAMALLCALGLWSRVARINRFFRLGTRVEGVITNLRIVKDRGRLEFQFVANGSQTAAWSPVHRTKRVLSMRPGQPVIILFDERNPKKAIVLDLFT